MFALRAAQHAGQQLDTRAPCEDEVRDELPPEYRVAKHEREDLEFENGRQVDDDAAECGRCYHAFKVSGIGGNCITLSGFVS